MIYRKAVTTVDVNAEAGAQEVVAIISTDTVDRDREVVIPSGGDLRNYRKNPVILFGHNTDLPIAQAVVIRVQNEQLFAKAKFASTQFAQDIFKLYQEKVLRAFSIGFMPLKGGPPDEKEKLEKPTWAQARWIIRSWELYEFSAVSVPANPEALATAVSKGMFCRETLARLGIRDPRERIFLLPTKAKLFVVPKEEKRFRVVAVPPKRRVAVV